MNLLKTTKICITVILIFPCFALAEYGWDNVSNVTYCHHQLEQMIPNNNVQFEPSLIRRERICRENVNLSDLHKAKWLIENEVVTARGSQDSIMLEAWRVVKNWKPERISCVKDLIIGEYMLDKGDYKALHFRAWHYCDYYESSDIVCSIKYLNENIVDLIFLDLKC